jgi:uncharacterized protein YdeI (YjbR/CyaY-like superfamily)
MSKEILFSTREKFRAWLKDNCLSDEGIWLIFGKKGGPNTLTANEALEEALCFGWIDGQFKSIDDKTYLKYFKQRRKNSNWSAKNIELADILESQGRMTDFGRVKIEEAKANGLFIPVKRPQITDKQISDFIKKIKYIEPAYSNFMAMSDSIKRTYTGYSLDVKSEDSKTRRLEKIIDRLNRNLKPM